MNKALICISFLLISLVSFGKIINVISPGDSVDIQPAIKAATDAASKYDTVQLPWCTSYFDSRIVINKKITILGYNMGGCKTKLYRRKNVDDATVTSWSNFFYFDINDSTDLKPFGISYIDFESKYPSFSPNDGGSKAQDNCIVINKGLNFVISNNSFRYFGHTCVLIIHYDNIAKGVICKNYFSTCKTYTGLGVGYGVTVIGEYKKWISDVKFGSDNFVFIEDNKFNEFRHSIASNGGSLMVVRYNEILNNIVANASAVDTHPKEDGATGSRAIECYRNKIINTNFEIHKWVNQSERDSYTPFHPTEDYGIQVDNGNLYKSNGIAAGSWVLFTKSKGNHLGAPFEINKKLSELGEIAINMRGGDALIHYNDIINWRFAEALSDGINYTGLYPIPCSPGYQSGLDYGECHSGTDLPYSKGDMFVWGNRFTPYGNSTLSKEFYNYAPNYFKEKRDYHLVQKPGYSEYIYPHPLNNKK